MSPNKLLQLAQKGDDDAFQRLVEPHIPTVRRLARTFARSWADADDIAQETLLRAYRSIGQYRGESSVSTWLFQLARNAGIDWYRSKQAKERAREDGELKEVEDVSPPHASQDSLLFERERAEQLWDTLGKLDPSLRIPLVLYEIESLSYEEIARVENIPVGTVRSRLNRARRVLSAALPADLRDSSATPRVAHFVRTNSQVASPNLEED